LEKILDDSVGKTFLKIQSFHTTWRGI
jgi:hypothetical protein